MSIDIKFPSDHCKRCDECLLGVKDRNGVTIVSCKRQGKCPYGKGKTEEEIEREENGND